LALRGATFLAEVRRFTLRAACTTARGSCERRAGRQLGRVNGQKFQTEALSTEALPCGSHSRS